MTQPLLIEDRDLLNHGASSDLLDAFRVRPIEVTIEAGGALGVAMVKWRFIGAPDWSSPEPSEAGTSWSWTLPDPAFAVVTFGVATYVEGQTWTVATGGTVTPQDGAPATVTASRTNVVLSIRSGVTSDFVTWAQPRCVPPILSIGEGQKAWAAMIAVWRLKLRSGVTPAEAGSGDAMLQREAERCEERIKGIGASAMRPPDIVDSSAGSGAGLSLLPTSESLRGW